MTVFFCPNPNRIPIMSCVSRACSRFSDARPGVRKRGLISALPPPPPPEISSYTKEPYNRASSPYNCAPQQYGAHSPTAGHHLIPSCPRKRARSLQARLLTRPASDQMERSPIIYSSGTLPLLHVHRPNSYVFPKELSLRGDLARDQDVALFTHPAIPHTVIRPQPAW